MSRVGAIDCGTNSIRLLVADVDESGTVRELSRETRIVRLGYGVDATGRIAAESMARTLAAARDYAAVCLDSGCEQVRFVATSASRDAENAAEFVDGVVEAFAAFGTAPEVISGAEEAALAFAGATDGLRAAALPAPYLVVDLGGGSTELVRGTDAVLESISLDIGSVRLSERHLRSDPPTEDEVWAALAEIVRALDRAGEVVDLTQVATLVGLAGSVTTVTAHALGQSGDDRAPIHGAQLPVEQVIDACSDLLTMSRADRAALPSMHPGRVDVIGGGVLVWRTVLQRLVRDSGIDTVRASETDILDGIAMSQSSV